MKLIADCGGTKCEWAVIDGSNHHIVATTGINAINTSQETVYKIIDDELLPHLGAIATDIDVITYYGAGCINDTVCNKIAHMLQSRFPLAKTTVASDLQGAAKALCGNSYGIACILGTGSNSCLYDGKEIIANVRPLGFILGDEGSGAVLGRRLVADIFKGLLPHDITNEFMADYLLDYPTLVERVYKCPGTQAYLASFVPFLSKHIDLPSLRGIVIDEFSRFIDRNVAQYPRWQELPLNFTGSVALHFEPLLREVCCKKGCNINKVIKSPLELLIEQAKNNQLNHHS